LRSEPVVLLPSVEHQLQGAHPKDEQGHTNIVNSHPRPRRTLCPRWVFDKAKDQEQCQNTHWQVNEENPSPGVVICDPAAKSRTNRWRYDRRDAIECESQTTLLGRKSICQDRLGHRL